ncbi:Pregnancy-associated glycoprotein 2 [Clonorchis sinensis]|uniref:Pregnancy-associated glycoprotein 2 n=1 Tax=Clonorchis sinensis TaxID=79923 RepID=A0A419PJV0_CLOSI|nr:Pregnancy-associated glycoprotein 2 [Clonorchis sinensis]
MDERRKAFAAEVLTRKHQLNGYRPLDEKARLSYASCMLNNWKDFYYGLIGIGTPSREFRLLFDTGSTILWVHNQNARHDLRPFKNIFAPNRSSSFVDDKAEFTAIYANFAVHGFVGTDIFKLGDHSFEGKFSPVLLFKGEPKQYDWIDGILGLGRRQAFPAFKTMFLDQLFEQRLISRRAFAFVFCSIDLSTDETLAIGLNALVDTGTPLTYLPANATTRLYALIGVTNYGNGNMVACDQIPSMPTLRFNFGGFELLLESRQYIFVKLEPDKHTWCCSWLFPTNLLEYPLEETGSNLGDIRVVKRTLFRVQYHHVKISFRPNEKVHSGHNRFKLLGLLATEFKTMALIRGYISADDSNLITRLLTTLDTVLNVPKQGTIMNYLRIPSYSRSLYGDYAIRGPSYNNKTARSGSSVTSDHM